MSMLRPLRLSQASLRAGYGGSVRRGVFSHSYKTFPPKYTLPRLFSTTPATPAATSVLDKEQKEKSEQPKKGRFADLKNAELGRLLKLMQPQMPLLKTGLVSLAVAAGITMYIPTGFGQLIDVVTQTGSADDLSRHAMGLAALFAVGGVASFGRVVSFSLAGNGMIARLRHDLFSKIVDQDMAFFDRNRTGELVNRLSSDVVVMSKAVIGSNLSSGLRSIAQGVFGLGYMIHLSPQLTAVMFGVVPVVTVGAYAYSKFVKSMSTKVQDVLARATEVSEEKLGNIRTVRAFANEKAERDRYNKEVDHVYELQKKEAYVSGVFFACAGFAGSLCMLGVLYRGCQLVLENQLSTGVLTSFLMYTGYVGFSIMSTSNFFTDLMKGLGASKRVFELMDSIPAIPNVGGVIPAHIEGKLEFQNVNFTYPTRPGPIFEDFSLSVEQGNVLALVGASGSGKSTIAGLVLRFYDPQGGRLLLDGVDVSTIDPTWLRQNIAIVSQEPTLFAATIEENIKYGNPDATTEDVLRCAREANADGFIRSFPHGYDTFVGERGVSLSGGQKQRVAIARALLRNPKLLILDEATSALDAGSETAVQEALERLMRGRTTIVIAHRLSTIKSANQIAVLHQGRIAELGTHEELMAKQGEEAHYRRLMRLQVDALA